jgi:galactose mutarotase-like enzyme
VEKLTLSDGTIEVVVLPDVGARLHRLRAFGHDLLRTPEDVAEHVRDPFFWGAYVMAPWCNRIAAGPVFVGSQRIALSSNFPDGSAIHGQVYARRWDRHRDGTLRVSGGGDGWPWAYEVALRIEVAGRSGWS